MTRPLLHIKVTIRRKFDGAAAVLPRLLGTSPLAVAWKARAEATVAGSSSKLILIDDDHPGRPVFPFCSRRDVSVPAIRSTSCRRASVASSSPAWSSDQALPALITGLARTSSSGR